MLTYLSEMEEELMRDIMKANKGGLPHICSHEWQFNLSSIYFTVNNTSPVSKSGKKDSIASRQFTSTFIIISTPNDETNL